MTRKPHISRLVSRATKAMLMGLAMSACSIEPPLHTVDPAVDIDPPTIDLDLTVLWDYLFRYDTEYDWQSEWIYGWDEKDRELFGPLGYTEPNVYELRRYFTHDTPYGPHSAPLKHKIEGLTLHTMFDFGYWDLLSWNDIQTPDGVQSVRIDESSTYEYVTASTGNTMNPARYNAPAYTRSFYQPEELFSCYEQAVSVKRDLEGFVYDEERGVWVKKLEMELQPLTYIYLPQIILHHNHRNGRVITAVDGNSDLSGMARTVNMNTGVTGEDAITVYANNRMKQGLLTRTGEEVDVIGGKVMTFGIPKINPAKLDTRGGYKDSYTKVQEIDRNNRHYLDVTVIFNNGMDSTLVFDVTPQVRKLFRGGVITVELDMDTVPVPRRPGGSSFDAVVKDFDEEQWEFDM